MLFEDDDISFIDNLDKVEKLPKCIAVNLKPHISLKDIWIPKQLLVNRRKAIDSYRNRPNIYHTLYKPDAQSFLVYSEDSKESTENKSLQTFELSNSYENNLSSISNIDQTNSPKQDISSEDENSEQELKLFLELLNKSPSHESKAKCQDKEKLESLVDTIHIEKQNKVENREQFEQVLDALNIESPITIENETEHDIKDKSEISDTLNSKCLLFKDKTLHSVRHNNEKSEKLVTVNIGKQNLDDSSDNTVSVEEIRDNSLASCSSTAVIELPVAYQKNSFQNPPTKQKNQKEKKKKNTVNKTIHLGDFLQTANSDGYEIPKRDEFYENLVYQGICVPHDLPEEEFYASPSQYNLIRDFPEENKSLAFNNNCAKSLFESNENVQSCEDDQSCEVGELENDTLTTTLVLENVSCKFNKDSVESLMSAYGKLKNISFETDGKSYKAYVKLVVEHDVEWVIECLDGNEPFGVSHGLLKCYKLQE